MGYDEIETKTGNRFPTLNGQTDRSTTELLRNNGRLDLLEFNSRSQPMTNMSSNPPS
ncbi:hypothetical protein F511_18990 [Dorcoceras hygrometricum]|uniref:Uncharacterized protein n=1 Tax=Dorcoceras hygrometricum TaxID=472368 RepID=A0A2Z7CV83_9LAMI|nr:hypothetical protein F511_19843 [Dorcoceras hygrometricum]KZV51010.1 hypothetical protein F511_18990 [Dorcoceras hygrometricum]